MEIIKNGLRKRFENPTGVGLGNFDGLHVGHMVLINTLIAESRLDCLDSVVYTFTKHTCNILRKKLVTPLLLTHEKKAEILEDTKLDYLFFEEFDEEYSRLSPEAFVREILKDKLNIRLAVTGFNYRFGYKGEGDVSLLGELAKRYGFELIVIPPVKIENETVSSTLIRSYITKGDVDRAFKLLGRHYTISGKVSEGRKIGSRIGIPTANIKPDPYLVLPYNGVYITKTIYRGKVYPSITNIGRNSTFEELDEKSVETHIFDYSGSMYGEYIEVLFIKKLRNERKFSSADKLVAQISSDIRQARVYHGSHL
jgi:riboflavin kinase / FMN adenylyltransferase